MYCSQCGMEINSNSRFCQNCGVRIIEYHYESDGSMTNEIKQSKTVVDNLYDENTDTKEVNKPEERNYDQLIKNQQEENELLRLQNTLLKNNMNKKEKKPRQTTAKMTFSVLALILIIAGINFPFYSWKDMNKISEWEEGAKLIKNTTNIVGYVDGFLGETNDSDMSDVNKNAKSLLTSITFLKVIFVVSIILLVVNLFIPVKTGMLLAGLLGVIMVIWTTTCMSVLAKNVVGDDQLHGNMVIGSWTLILGFVMEMFADPGLSRIMPKQYKNDFMK